MRIDYETIETKNPHKLVAIESWTNHLGPVKGPKNMVS